MKLEDLNRLEEQFNFKYPDSYKRLCLDGMLNGGKLDPQWDESTHREYCKHPSLLLFGRDFSLLYADAVQQIIRSSQYEERCANGYLLVPFAQSSGSNYYCFYANNADADGEMQVVLVKNGGSEALILAQNLPDFIFRNLLETVGYFSKENGDSIDDIRNMLSTHLRYLKPNEQKILIDIYNRPFQEYDCPCVGGATLTKYESVMKREALEELIKDAIGFDNLDVLLKC